MENLEPSHEFREDMEHATEKSESLGVIKKLRKIPEIGLIFISLELRENKILTVLTLGEKRNLSEALLGEIQQVLTESRVTYSRIYPIGGTREALETGNLYFIRNCLLGELVYQKPDLSRNPFLRERYNIRQLMLRSEEWFSLEIENIHALIDGASFFKKKKKYNHAAHLVHQAVELQYRCLEKFAMGKEENGHLIRKHLDYAHPFIHGAGRLFKEHDRKDEQLLDLLDQASDRSRYTHTLDITKRELKLLLKRADIMQRQIREVFEFRFEDCYIALEREAVLSDGGEKPRSVVKRY